MPNTPKLIKIIASCSDPQKLRNWIQNAATKGARDVEEAARRRLVDVQAASNIEDPSDALVLDFWKSITALELELSEERGKTIRLNRTRQKIARVGVLKTLGDLVLQSTPSQGYFLLRERGMLDMSAEAVVLRFASRFEPETVQSARDRLMADGFQV